MPNKSVHYLIQAFMPDDAQNFYSLIYTGQQQAGSFTSSNKPKRCGQRAYSADARNKPKHKDE
jgi:hypothetical protein